MLGQAVPAEFILRVYKGSDWYLDFQLLDENETPINTSGLELKLHMQFKKADGSSEVIKLVFPTSGITGLNLPSAEFRALIAKTDLIGYCAGKSAFDFDWKAGGLEERLISGVIETFEGVDNSD